jgi:aryl-alcohol dehydrogenase-like predicted oxidoreductase
MKKRQLGNTGIEVSEIGLGAWQLANPIWGASDPGEAVQIVEEAVEAGCNFFDTAPGYNHGKSEEFLGQVLKGRRGQAVICTKFGHTADGKTDFATAAIRPSLEDSLRRLQTDYVDVLLLHNPPRGLMDGRLADQYAELEKLKDSGKVRAFGVSLDWEAELRLVSETTGSSAAEVLFNIFHQEPRGAFSLAEAQGVGLIIKVPLDSGWLTGKYTQQSTFKDVRDRWSQQVIERRAALVEEVGRLLPEGTSLVHGALQFILAHPQVSTVIPGAKTVRQARDNFAAADTRLPEESLEGLKALWQREIQDDPLPW